MDRMAGGGGGGGEGAGWILMVHPYRFPKEMGSLRMESVLFEGNGSKLTDENGSLQRTSVQHSFELLYVRNNRILHTLPRVGTGRLLDQQ